MAGAEPELWVKPNWRGRTTGMYIYVPGTVVMDAINQKKSIPIDTPKDTIRIKRYALDGDIIIKMKRVNGDNE